MNRTGFLPLLLLAGLMAGCHLGPAYHAPAPPTVIAGSYKEAPANVADSGDWKPAAPSEAMLKGRWWEVFGDTELNGLEERLEINNENIKQFYENYMAARAEVAEARAGLAPTVTFNPAATVSHSPTGVLSSPAATGNSGTHALYTLPLDASWEPDIWGKVANEVRAAANGAQVSAADLENEKLTEEATLAQTFFELRGQDQLQKTLDESVTADKNALQIAQSRYNTGVDTQLAVTEAEAALDSAGAAATGVANERAQYEHAIATLVGVPATDFALAVRPTVFIPPAVPIGVPSQLLERRPDVAAAERTVARDNAEIDLGYSAFFPQLTITGTLGLESSAIKKLISLPSRIWSVGPSLSQTLYNGGLYRAELAQYTATYNADVAAYRQTALTAFQQVEDGLAGVRVLSAQAEKEAAAVESAQKFLDMERARYRTGLDPYTDVLTAQLTLISNQQSLITLEVSRMTAAVSLVQALGGGWDANQLPSTAATGAKHR